MDGKAELKRWAVERIKKVPDHIVAAVISLGVTVLLLGGGAAIFSDRFRSALLDFLTARIYVWALLLSIAALGVAFAVAWRRSRRMSRARSYFDAGIDEIEHLGVVWPVQWAYSVSRHDPRPQIGMPRCPKDKTPLGWCVDEQTPRAIVDRVSDLVVKMRANDLVLACFTCGQQYRLDTSEKYELGEVMAIVAERAKGEWAMAHERPHKSRSRTRARA
jgi:hypothetical protein